MRSSVWRRLLSWSLETLDAEDGPPSDKTEPADFELTKYGYDRQHELELNKATHALEVEQLKLLVLLNGGAAAALLTFAARSTNATTGSELMVPVLLWSLGLLSAASATLVMGRLQAKYSSAYRHRRHAIEWRQFDKKVAKGEIGSNPLDLPGDVLLDRMAKKLTREEAAAFAWNREFRKGDLLHDKAATFLRNQASWLQKWMLPLSVASILLFVAGALTAAARVASAAQ